LSSGNASPGDDVSPGDDAEPGSGPGDDAEPGANEPSDGSGDSKSDGDSRSGGPHDPDEAPRWLDRPVCHERGKCVRPSHHHRPDFSRHRQCDNATHRAVWAHHRAGRARGVTVHLDTIGRHEHRAAIRLPATASFADIAVKRSKNDKPDHRTASRRERAKPAADANQRHPTPELGGGQYTSQVRHSSVAIHSRRSEVTERPQNVRAASVAARSHAGGGHNSRRAVPESRNPGPCGDEDQTADRASYRGNHRAGGQHHADQTPAQQRSSRIGRHHADQHDDHTTRG
jgi:hypothetical protein